MLFYLSSMLDIIALVVAALGFYIGYSKGLIKTVFGILSIILGILIALKLSPFIINFIEAAFKLDPRWALILGFLLTLGLVIAGLSYVGRLMERFLQSIQLNFVNKIAGGLLYGVIFLVILGLAESFLTELEVIKPAQIEESFTYPIVTALPNQASGVFDNLKPIFSEFWEKTKEVLDNIEGPEEH